MRSFFVVAILAALCLTLVTPNMSWCGGYYYGYGYHGYHGHYNGDGYWFAGGLILGSILGTVFSPYYYARPAPVYVYPAPAYVYTQPAVERYLPNQAYAYPDPSYTRGSDAAQGEWVTVPGQSVNGRWVPEHRVWVPNR